MPSSSKRTTSTGPLARQCSVDSVKPPAEIKIQPSISASDLGSQQIISSLHSGRTGSAGAGAGSSDYKKHSDCIVFLVYCPQHDQVLLSCQQQQQGNTSLVYLPFMEVPLWNEAWSSTARYRLCQLLANNDAVTFRMLTSGRLFAFRCLQLLRLQLPATSKFVTRATYLFQIKSSSPSKNSNSPTSAAFTCCQPIEPSLKWFPLGDIIEEKIKLPPEAGQNPPGFWGPELVELCKLFKANRRSPKTRLIEVSLEEATQLASRDSTSPRTAEEELLLGHRLSSADLERMYVDYVDFCSPSYYLSPTSFGLCLSKLGLLGTEHRSQSLFAAFNFTVSGRLSFQELLAGMALYDPSTPANSPARLKFVFRYYNVDKSGLLSLDQLKALLVDLGPTFGSDESKVKAVIDGLGGGDQFPLSVAAFLKAAEEGKLPDTSKLVRSSKPTFQSITRSIAIKNLVPNKKALASRNIGSIIIKRHRNICPTCKSIRYELASHAVTLKLSGELMVSRVLNEVVAGMSGKAYQKQDSKEKKKKQKDKPLTMLSPQQFSRDFVFNPASVANRLLKAIRDFSRVKGSVWQPRGLLESRPEELWTLLVALYREMDVLLETESKCQKVYSPCYVIGDVHGNLEDLLTLEATVWPTMPLLSANYLFLGDYVDRGKWSLETAVYLMAFKVLCPNKVTLLRGNHEVRLLQLNYSYKAELLRKYGERYGTRIWELTNRLFDKMPVCALLDDAVFAAHGGIPKSAATIEQINSRLPREIRDPQNETPIAWEILWSDPANRDDFNDTCAARGVDPDTTNGFVFNLKRGTAFRFNQQAAAAFLSANSLTHIIRAHEVIPFGYTFHFGAVCATIFSSSHYCGNDNDCCVILADNQRLQILHVDTAGNSTATN